MSESKYPKEWVLSTIGEVCELNPKQKLDDNLNIGFMPMAGVPKNFLGNCLFETRKWNEVKKGFTQFQDEDVIFAKITPCFENGKASIIKGFPNGYGAGSTEYYVLRPVNKLVNPKWLFARVKTKDFLTNGALNMSGSVGHKRVTKEFIENYPLPIPTVAEQKIIADKLDTLLAQVNSAKARLEKIPQILKRFRQAVLAASVSGKLTEDWRGQVKLINWKNGILKEFIKKPTYGTSAKSQKEGLIPVLRMGNLQGGSLDWTDLAYTSDPVEIKKYKLEPKDILFNRTNSPELVGKTSIYNGENPAIYAGYLLRIQCLPELSPEFLNYHLNSHLAKQYCYSVKTDGVSQSNINAQKLAAYPLNVPPLIEQLEIVRRVEQLFAYANAIEKQVNNALSRVNNLTPSILAKAFRGELTVQWREENPELISGENSAAVLLENIKAERAASGRKRVLRKKT